MPAIGAQTTKHTQRVSKENTQKNMIQIQCLNLNTMQIFKYDSKS